MLKFKGIVELEKPAKGGIFEIRIEQLAMFNSDTELFFPIRVIPSLKNVRGNEWEQLVERISNNGVDEIEKIAFSALIIKLAGCQGCDADSFRAMRGCTQCSKTVVKRYKGSDNELLEQYSQCVKDVSEFISKR